MPFKDPVNFYSGVDPIYAIRLLTAYIKNSSYSPKRSVY
jgi:hypothetical protein